MNSFNRQREIKHFNISTPEMESIDIIGEGDANHYDGKTEYHPWDIRVMNRVIQVLELGLEWV